MRHPSWPRPHAASEDSQDTAPTSPTIDSAYLAANGVRLRAEDTVPWPAQVAGAWALRFLLVVAAIYVIFNLLNAISLVAITMTVAMMLSALLGPAVAWLVRRGMPR